MKILLVEDNRAISKGLVYTLEQNGFEVALCENAESTLNSLGGDFDLFIVDVSLPDGNGFELCDEIKRVCETPVIFLTALDDEDSIVKGFDLGAEDYITKPFNISELQARVDAILRRYNKAKTKLSFKDIVIDTNSRIVTKNGVQIDLTLKEYEILLLFVRNKNIALYREMIYERVWNEPYMGDTRTVDLHIQRLRKKLDLKDNIQSVYKVGYRLVE